MVRAYVIYSTVNHHRVAFTKEPSLFPSKNIRVVPTRSFPLLLCATVLDVLVNHPVLERTIDLEALGQLEDIDSPNLNHFTQ